jgi:hypothetical protein
MNAALSPGSVPPLPSGTTSSSALNESVAYAASFVTTIVVHEPTSPEAVRLEQRAGRGVVDAHLAAGAARDPQPVGAALVL